MYVGEGGVTDLDGTALLVEGEVPDVDVAGG